MNIYHLSRSFFNWAFLNPEIIKPSHIALYFFAIEQNNRLGWKPKFGLPTTMAMEAIGIKSYTTYIDTFNDLVNYGFFSIIQRSKNQYSSNIIALSNIDKALDKALDKAIVKHTSKQEESTHQSTVESIVSIDKPIYNTTNLQTNNTSVCEDSDINNLDLNQATVNQAEASPLAAASDELIAQDTYNIENVLDPKGGDNFTIETLLKNNGLMPNDLDKIYQLWVNKHITLQSVFDHRQAMSSIANFIINYGSNNRKPPLEVKSTIINSNKLKSVGTFSQQKELVKT